MDIIKLKTEQDTLRQQLITMMTEKEISIHKLAELIHLPYQTVRRFINGYNLNFASLIKVHKSLNP